MSNYRMDYPDLGSVVIINIKHFAVDGLETRVGTGIDAGNVEKLFKTMGFKNIRRKDDITADNIRAELEEVSRLDHSESSCFVCVVLTHGERDFVYGIDEELPLSELFEPFTDDRCKTLVGKPRLFFIQACRGHLVDSGVAVATFDDDSVVAATTLDDDSVEDESDSSEELFPSYSDYFIAYSTAPGYASFRNVEGSCFIRAIVNVFSKEWTRLDLQTMMTRVIGNVAFNFHSKSKKPDQDNKKQIPCVTSMLTKKLYFKSD
ncbi:unnamed protein product [Lymnaea stagnalis]|uniref:Caspase-3 n=1 Tax=Lymnaea stagnalis TaxID=6523 RepID=A0AAV2I6R5_LYMST